ncbi:hypothetical protein L6R50_19940 [Myxococcota bacterium]|nr:hypothetical protein [Myxococcota bacterium]
MLDSSEATSRAEIARREGLTRARVTQIMNLLRLPPEVLAKLEGGEVSAQAMGERKAREMVRRRAQGLAGADLG